MTDWHKANANKLPLDTNITPFVVLTRLTEEEIEHFTSMNRSTSSRAPSKSIQIKQERPAFPTLNVRPENQNGQPDVNPFDRTAVENGTQLTTRPGSFENLNIKLEETDMREIKIDPNNISDTYSENLNDNTTFSNYSKQNTTTIVCKICFKSYDTTEEYLLHKHKNDKPYSCELCEVQFSLQNHLDLHLKKHVYEICSKRQLSSTLLTKRNCKTNTSLAKRKKPNLDPFKCTECIYSTVDEVQFLSHTSSCFCNTNTELIQCQLCLKSFHTQAALNGHMKYHAVRGEIASHKNPAKVGNQKSNGSGLIAQRVISAKNSITFLTCKYCYKKFSTSHQLHTHYMKHKKKLVCKVCNEHATK